MQTFRILLFLIGTISAVRVGGAEPAAGKQVEQELKLPDNKSVPYLLYLPKDYDSKEAKWPLLLFLHGRGESDGPLSVVKKWGPPRLIERGENFPYIVISPQCPRQESWPQPGQQTLLLALLDHIEKQFKADADRVYLTGLSMGGYGAWRLAADHPERFAALVPICGGGKPEDAVQLKGMPIWVFHGTEDKAVPFQRSVEMVDALKAAGSTAIRFTSLENIGHNCWEAAYATPEVYQWLEKQSLSQNGGRAKQN
ncbi:MAG TPA: prolyl oligopeptidase family serine peptidase [Haliangiales bacterium]|nr:prolyl oligopeptidase family serine peptidase [Haliangiales bacterium]